MVDLIVATNTILGNEKAWELMELDLQSPKSRGFHRYQIIRVNRNGVMAEFRHDMGLTKKWKGVKQIRIPSLWEHTVDELKALAEELRYEHNFDYMDYLQLDKVNLA